MTSIVYICFHCFAECNDEVKKLGMSEINMNNIILYVIIGNDDHLEKYRNLNIEKEVRSNFLGFVCKKHNMKMMTLNEYTNIKKLVDNMDKSNYPIFIKLLETMLQMPDQSNTHQQSEVHEGLHSEVGHGKQSSTVPFSTGGSSNKLTVNEIKRKIERLKKLRVITDRETKVGAAKAQERRKAKADEEAKKELKKKQQEEKQPRNKNPAPAAEAKVGVSKASETVKKAEQDARQRAVDAMLKDEVSDDDSQ
jgi:hypothetical protein